MGTGWLDVNLTDAGKMQAKNAGEFLKKIEFDKIYSSDLARARQTAENALPGCDYETSDLLREINVKDGYTMFDGESKPDEFILKI